MHKKNNKQLQEAQDAFKKADDNPKDKHRDKELAQLLFEVEKKIETQVLHDPHEYLMLWHL